MNKKELTFWLAEHISIESFRALVFTLPADAIRAGWDKSKTQPGVLGNTGTYGKIDETDVQLAKIVIRNRVPSRDEITTLQATVNASSLKEQQGGSHYKGQKIQPVEYIHANGIGFMEGSVIKYVTRHKLKNGVEDINKAIHFLQLIKELEYGESR